MWDSSGCQGLIQVQLVAIAAALPLARDQPLGLEVGQDLLDRALGDADALGDLAQPQLGLGRQGDQDVGVVGQEGPGVGRRGGCLWFRSRGV